MIEVVSRQRKRKIDTQAWETFAQRAADAIGHNNSSATIAFVSDKTIRGLNRQFRGVDKATDVLSFPADDTDETNLGDIAISVETADAQATENGLKFDEEVAQLILHGLLHLCGYDHETDNGEMNKLEVRLRKKLGI
jgi:probable rRNA maturation factor